MSNITVYRGGNVLSVRSGFDSTRDMMMPIHLAYGGVMVGLWNPGLPQVTLVPSTATDAQVWPAASPGTGTMIHDTADDICPINTGWSYVGGNHGYSVGNQVTVPGHGKTTADVGSQWTDGTNIHTLLAVTNANSLLFANPYTIVDGIARGTTVRPAAPLTHVSGATNRGSVPITNLTPNVQILPSTHSCSVVVELDGRQVPDGKSTGQELRISETYLVASYQGMIDTAQARVGTPIATIMRQVPPLCRVSNVYRWSTRTLLVTQRVTALTRFTLNMGVTQSVPLTKPANSARRQFMPNVGKAGGLDWSVWADIDRLTALTDITPATLRDPLMPASSMSQWVIAWNNVPQWGITVGLLPIDDGQPSIRSRYTTAKSWFISSSMKKNYPQLVWGRTLEPGESVAGTAYRRYLVPPSTATEIVVSDGTRDFVMIERAGTVADALVPAPQLENRLLVPVGPTNLTVPERVPAEGIRYSVSVAPGYGMWRAEPDPTLPEARPGATHEAAG